MTTDDLRALDIEIAKALGWTVKKGRDGYARLFEPNGAQVQGIAFSEANAWILAPAFTTDANAALTLVDAYFICETRRNFDDNDSILWYVKINLSHDALEATFPLAICKAWLAWKHADSALSS